MGLDIALAFRLFTLSNMLVVAGGAITGSSVGCCRSMCFARADALIETSSHCPHGNPAAAADTHSWLSTSSMGITSTARLGLANGGCNIYVKPSIQRFMLGTVGVTPQVVVLDAHHIPCHILVVQKQVDVL